MKNAAMRPPENTIRTEICFTVSRISSAAECLPESSCHFLTADISPAKLNVTLIADFIQNYRLMIFLAPLIYQLGGAVCLSSLDAAMGDPGQVVIIIRFAVMNGSEMMIRILLTDNASISFPVRKRFLMHQIIFISQGPPYISICGKTCQHILPVAVIILCFHHGESPSVIRMHNNQICLDSQIHKCLNTLFNMLEMGWIESGKVPVIAWSTAIIFREIILI